MSAITNWARFLALPAILTLSVSCDDSTMIDSPNAPSNLRSGVVEDANTELVWDDNSTTEDGFIVEKRDDSASEFIEVARVKEPTWIDTSPMILTKTYQYRVAAYRGSQLSGYSNTISLSHNMEVPREFRVDPASVDRVKLIWETNNNSSSTVIIERSPTGTNSWSHLVTTSHSGSYIDASVTVPGPWFYRIAQVSPNNQTAFSQPVGAVYGLSKTESHTANQIANNYGCALSYQSFVLPELDLLIQFSKTRTQLSYSYYISRLSDGNMLVNNSIFESQIQVTFTPDQKYFLADNKNMSGSGKVLQLHDAATGNVVKSVPVGNMRLAGLISDSKAVATVFRGTTNGNTHYDIIEVDLNLGEITVLHEDLWITDLATSSIAGHYLVLNGNGTAKVYDRNHAPLNSWNLVAAKLVKYSPDGTELLIGYEQMIETFSTSTYSRKVEANLPQLYKYASYSPDNNIYTTYCSPVTLNPPAQPSTWVQKIDRTNGQVQAYSVSSTPAMVYSLDSKKMHVIYTDSIRTLSFGWMPAIAQGN